jgi:hypothetical protein
VRAVAYQLASRLPQYADHIDTPEVRRVLENVELDPPSAIELGVMMPLGHLEAPAEGPSLLCIDALDEAVTFREGPSIVSLLESRIDRLPPWLRLVATTRDDKIVTRQLGRLRATVIDAAGTENFEDLKTYVMNQLADPSAGVALDGATMTTKSFIESLLQHSEGSFLYAEHFLQGVLRGGIRFDDLDDLPPGLDGTYQQYLRRAFPTATAVDQIRPVLEVLCAADGPISRLVLADAARLNERELIKLLTPLNPFVRQTRSSERESGLSFWHKSFYDFLTAIENADSEFGIDQTKGDEAIGSFFVDLLSKEDAKIDLQASVDSLPDYLRRRGLDHLALCGRFFDRLSESQVAHLVCRSAWPRYVVAAGGLPSFAPAFVSRAIAKERLDAIEQLVEALATTTDLHYLASGLIQIEKRPDGSESRIITARATEATPLHRALVATGLSVWVLDQVLAERGADSTFSAIVEKMEGMDYMASGLGIAGWSYGLSGYFEDHGYALHKMISNLRNGIRAQSWKH